ncbi:hypothetical protein BOX15_Mlig007728g1 [Macrostomum lignano]|uniref:Microtubule associated protein SPM2 n=3 Tax=Macrostomum lignano TaxID=282301 RepID=A0A1I8GEM9_9PLAT|nr:hypothetical protein BOX15_Mlig007728g1 [Macrostomum lignano]
MALVESSKDQAQSNYLKNRGNPGQWFQHKADYREPQPAPRVRPEAQEIAQKNKPTVGEVFHNYRLPPDDAPAPVRLRDEDARRIADKFNNQEDKWFDFHGNYAFRPKPRPVKVYPPSNVELMQRANQAREGDWFDHNKKPDPQAAPGPKCTSEAGREIARSMRSQADWYRHDARPTTAPSTRPSSRTRGEGAEYAERNRHGTGTDWMTRKVDPAEDGVAVYGHRCPTSSSLANYEASSKGSQMRDCFDYSRGASHQEPPVAAAKVKGDLAQEVYQRNTRGHIGVSSSAASAAEQAADARVVRKTRPEAEEFANRAKGQMSQWFNQEQNRQYSSPRPQPRVRPGPAQEAAERNRGVMDSCLGDTDYRAPPKDHKTHERALKSDVAKELAAKGRGDAAKALLGSSNMPPEPPRKSKATSGLAEEHAARNRGTASLVITGAAAPSSARAGPRVRPEAAETAQKYRGGDFFKTMQMKPPSAR